MGAGIGCCCCSFFSWSLAACPRLSFSSAFSKSWKGSGKSNGVGSSRLSLLPLFVAACTAAAVFSFGLGGMEGLCLGGAGLVGGWLLRDRDGEDCEGIVPEAIGSSRSPSEEEEEAARPCCSPSLSSMVSMSSVTGSRWLPLLLSMWSLQLQSSQQTRDINHSNHFPDMLKLISVFHFGGHNYTFI